MSGGRTIVALVASRAQRRKLVRLRRAFPAHVTCCSRVDDVDSAVAGAGALLTAACDVTGTPVAPTLQRLRRFAPSLAIILVIGRDSPSTAAVAALRLADHVVFDAELDDRATLAAVAGALHDA